jgi:peroxiredoxin
MRSDIVPGGIFPDFQLPDHTNTARKLSELQGDDPLIVHTENLVGFVNVELA